MTERKEPEAFRSFQSFIDVDEVHPPRLVSDTIRSQVKRDIDPTLRQVVTKFFALQAAALAATLTVCPQFGLGPIGGGHGIMHVVMKYGEAACAVFCAFILFGTTLLLARFFLTQHEKRVAANSSFATATVVSSLSFAFFMVLDAVTPSVVVNITYGLIWAAAGAGLLLLVKFFPARGQH